MFSVSLGRPDSLCSKRAPMPLCGSKDARLAVGERKPFENIAIYTPGQPSYGSVFKSDSVQRPYPPTAVSFGGRILGPDTYDGAVRAQPWLDEKDMFREGSSFASHVAKVGPDWAGQQAQLGKGGNNSRPLTAEIDFSREPARTRSALQPPGGLPAVPGAYGKSWPVAVEPPPPPRDYGLELQSDALYRPEGSLAEAMVSSGLNYTHSFRSSQSRLHPPPKLCDGQQNFLVPPAAATNAMHVKEPRRISSTFRVQHDMTCHL